MFDGAPTTGATLRLGSRDGQSRALDPREEAP